MEIKEIISHIKHLKSQKELIDADIQGLEQMLFQKLEEQKLSKDEGTVNLDGATVSYKMSRSIDQKILQEYSDKWPDSVKKCIKWKADLDLKAYRGVQEFDKDGFAIISKYVTSKPAKPSIKFNDEE